MRLFLILLGVLTLVGAAWAVPREYSAAILFRSDSQDVMTAFNTEYEADRSTPLSLRAIREVSSACMNVSANLFFMLQPSEIQKRIQTNCADYAKRMSSTSPLAAYPYTALALTSATPSEQKAAIEKSYALARHEGWQAKIRVIQALNPSVDVQDIAEADVATLLGSPELAQWLAGYYLEKAEYRPQITALVGTTSPALQSRFLQSVRRQSEQSN